MSDQDSKYEKGASGGTDAKLGQIQELENKLKLLRWGLFAGVLLVMVLGISSIWKTTKRAAKPAVEVYKEAKATYEIIKPKIDDAQKEFSRISNKLQAAKKSMEDEKSVISKIQNDTKEAIESVQSAQIIFDKMQPDLDKAYATLNGLVGNDDDFAARLRASFETEYENNVKPAAEDLSKKILVDIQHEAGEKFSDVSVHADEIMAGATRELHALTNSIPEKVTFALNETLIKMINSRDEKLRKMFPKLTKEKQAALVSRLSGLSKEQGEKIFLNLFAEHVSELGQVSDSLLEIQRTEPLSASSNGGKLGDIQTSLALLSAILEIAKEDFSTETDITTPLTSPANKRDKPEKKEPVKVTTPEKETALKTPTEAKPEEKE
jgi:uncharacterized alkaline shock family protein YloU